MALEITWNHYWNQGINKRFLNRESQFLRFLLDIPVYYKLSDHKPLFGKQESQKLIQESRNQAKNLKILESRRRKFRVADPST